MLRSMYSGVSGLRGHQTMMDVVGNNIANVNTTGYKASQTIFQDLLSQVLQGAGMPEGAGGTNPAQVGLGMRLAGIDHQLHPGRSAEHRPGHRPVDPGRRLLRRPHRRPRPSTPAPAPSPSTPTAGSPPRRAPSSRAGPPTPTASSTPTRPSATSSCPSAPSTTRRPPRTSSSAATSLPTPPDGSVIRTSITLFDDQGTAINATFVFTKTGVDRGARSPRPTPTATAPPTTSVPPRP